MDDISLKGNCKVIKVIKKTIRIYHFFNCKKLRGVKDAYKSCQISPREFDVLSDKKWLTLATEYGFKEEFDIDYLYWRIRSRKKEEEDYKVLSD
jgi:hypothetical protein